MTEGQSQTVSEFLGIETTYIYDGKGLKMNNNGLINNIFKTLYMGDWTLRTNPTEVLAPPSNDSLGKKSNIQDKWKY